MHSLWKKDIQMPVFPVQAKDIHTDVLIIGGGIAGLLCAYFLDRAGVDYTLAEAEEICGGVTENTTAKLTFQHGAVYDKLINTYSLQYAQQYLQANQDALDTYARLCRDIDCDYESKSACVYSVLDPEVIQKEAAAYRSLNIPARYFNTLPLPFPVTAALEVENQAQFHPLKFAGSIAKGLRILEQTKVQQLLPGQAITNRGAIFAKKIIVATHFPIVNKHGSYFLKLYQHRSYVLALKNAQKVDAMYIDAAMTGLSFRNYGDLLLLGGGSHRTGKSGGNWKELEAFARRYYPDATEVARWATQDCMSLDGVPYIGRYGKYTENLYVATGFNKWGMTGAMVSAKILSNLVQEKHAPYEDIFSPSRRILHPQLMVNAAESVLGLLTPTTPRCPHLGCALKYNKAEHSWDCPCHGSRFTLDGQLINNPATDDKR